MVVYGTKALTHFLFFPFPAHASTSQHQSQFPCGICGAQIASVDYLTHVAYHFGNTPQMFSPAPSPSAPAPLTVPLTVRIAQISNQHLTMGLTGDYVKYIQAAEKVETERYNQACTYPNSIDIINRDYDLKHHQLINCLQQAMNSRNEELYRPAHHGSVPAKATVSIGFPEAVMTRYYNRNYTRPYPSTRILQVIAGGTGISAEQALKWFNNRRSRDGNTHKKCDIPKKRKECVDRERDEIFMIQRDINELKSTRGFDMAKL